MSGIESDVQQLTPGAILEFWELDATGIGGGALRFQGQQDGVVWWQGQDYAAWPCQGEGFERTADQQPTPKFRVGNVDRSITILCQALEDMVGATLTRRRTFAKYLDSANVPDGPNLAPGNGTFDSLTGWTVTLGVATASGGKLHIGRSDGPSALHFTFPSELGRTYAVNIPSVEVTSATCRAGVALNDGSLGLQGTLPGGSIQFTFVGTGGTVYLQIFTSVVSEQSEIDSISVVMKGLNPTADPTKEFPPELWFIERKGTESFEVVEFELSSALDFQGVKLPRRQIVANQCPATYRDALCGYTGPPVADELDQPTSDPLLDKCGKRLGSCRLREWPDDVLNFVGFPAAGLVRT